MAGLLLAAAGEQRLAGFDPARMREESPIGHPAGSAGAAGLLSVAVDGDEGSEILVGTPSMWYLLDTVPGTSPLRVRYAREVASSTHPYPNAVKLVSLCPGDVDGDARPEVILLFSNGDLEVCDGRTGERRVTWKTSATKPRAVAAGRLEGGPEDVIAVLSADDLAVYRAGESSPLWSYPGSGGWGLAIGNVDTDPALEVVVATDRDVPGLVIDAGAHVVDWYYAGGFGRHVALGDVDGDGIQEIATGSGSLVDGVTRAARWSIPRAYTDWIPFVADVDADGAVEVLFTLSVYSASGVPRRTASPDDIPSMTVADVDGDCVPEVLTGTSSYASGLSARDGRTWLPKGSIEQRDGPYGCVAVGDLYGEGRTQMVWASISTNYWSGPTVAITDRHHHRETSASTFPRVRTAWPPALFVVLGQLDADPQLEFAFSDGTSEGRIGVYDARTLELQWASGLFYGQAVTSLATGDVDGDGAREIAVGTGYPASNADGNFLRLYDARTGVLIWKSPSFATVPSTSVAGIRIADLDGRPGAELLAAVARQGLYAFDGTTRAQLWLEPLPDISALEVGDVDGNGRTDVLVGTSAGLLRAYDGTSRSPLFSVDLGLSVNGIRVADLDGDGAPELVVAVGSTRSTVRVLSAQDRSLLWESPSLAVPAGANEGLLLADTDQDGNLEIAVGTQLSIRFFEYGSGAVDVTAPAFPGAVGLQSVTAPTTGCCSALDLSWGLANDDASPPVAYRVYRGSGAGFLPDPSNLLLTTFLTTYRDESVLPDREYAYLVRAVDAAGNEDANSRTLFGTYPQRLPLTVVTHPIGTAICGWRGTRVTFSVAATGSNLSYQWRKNGYAIGGATAPIYTIPSADSSSAGVYSCVVSDGCASVSSAGATLRVDGIPGDVGGDCQVRPDDVFLLIDGLARARPFNPAIADVNGDGGISSDDVTYLTRYLFEGGPAPVVR